MASVNTLKSGLAKITATPKYCWHFGMPINILRNQKLFKCRSFDDLRKWNNQRDSKWLENVKRIGNKKLANKNVIVAGFYSYLNKSILEDIFPSLEEANNIFFVENRIEFVEDVIDKLKIINKKNPTIYIIDVGVCVFPLPDSTIKGKLSDIKFPLYTRNAPNVAFYVDTQEVIDTINNDYYEENLMIKE